MPPAVIGGIGAAVGGALGLIGSSEASNTQATSNKAALDFAKQQEAERVREWNLQQQAAKYAWQVQQANLAPYRAARASVLAKYGINADVTLPQAPPDFGGATPPPGWKPGDPLPGAPGVGGPNITPPQTGGQRPIGPGAMNFAPAAPPGMPGAAAGPTAGMPTGGSQFIGDNMTLVPGMQDLTGGTGAPQVPVTDLANWSDWLNMGTKTGQA